MSNSVIERQKAEAKKAEEEYKKLQSATQPSTEETEENKKAPKAKEDVKKDNEPEAKKAETDKSEKDVVLGEGFSFDAKPEPEQKPSSNDFDAQLKAAESRYKTLEGKYKAEVPRLIEENKKLREDIETLKNSSAGDSDPWGSLESEYGDDAIAKVKSYLEQYGSQTSTQLAEVSEKLQRLEAETESQKRENMLRELDRTIPDWRKINVRTDWLEWLVANGPYRGKSYQQLLDEASARFDGALIAEIFEKFKNSTGKSKGKRANVASDDLEEEISPDTASSNSAVPKDRKAYTTQDVNDMLVKAEKYARQGKNKEANKLLAGVDAILATPAA